MLTSLTSTPASFLYCATSFFQPASCPGTVEIQNVSDLELPPEPEPDPPQAVSRRTPAVATAARGTTRRMPPRPSRRERRTPTLVIFFPFRRTGRSTAPAEAARVHFAGNFEFRLPGHGLARPRRLERVASPAMRAVVAQARPRATAVLRVRAGGSPGVGVPADL